MLKQRDYEMYMYIHHYIEERGYSPLLAEIAEALSLSGPDVKYQLRCLQAQDYIYFPPFASGSIYLTGKKPDVKAVLKHSKSTVQGQLRQQAIYHYIEAYIEQHHYSPSLKEIAMALDMGTTTVKYHVDRLKEAGYLESQLHKKRTLRLTGRKLAG